MIRPKLHVRRSSLFTLNGLKRVWVVCVCLLCLQAGADTNSPCKYKLAICAVFQNESFFLKEWLEFHKLMGVEHFYLFNNLSTDNSLEILKPYVAAGEVDLFEWPVETLCQKDYLSQLQLPAYNYALELAKVEASWIAFIDLDEFLFPVVHSSLTCLLEEYASVAGLAVNWQLYGTSGIERLLPNQLITENLIWRAETSFASNQIIKMLVQPMYVKAINNPHYFEFYEGYAATDSAGRRLPNSVMGQPVNVERIRINHYWCGTKEWLYTQKVARRQKWGLSFSPSLLDAIDMTYNQVEDRSLLRFLPQLKIAMTNHVNEGS